MGKRDNKLEKFLRKLAASFFERESNRESLITVTRVLASPDWKRATIYLSVLPEEKELPAFKFAKRKLRDLRLVVKKEATFKTIPFFDVAIDRGEKNREAIEQLIKTSKQK